jgi:hypothetical protein
MVFNDQLPGGLCAMRVGGQKEGASLAGPGDRRDAQR